MEYSINISEAMYNMRKIENLKNITNDQLDDIFNGVENSYMSIEGNGNLSKDSIKGLKRFLVEWKRYMNI